MGRSDQDECYFSMVFYFSCTFRLYVVFSIPPYLTLCLLTRFVDDMAEVDDDDEEDYDEHDRANANELSAMER